jgi:hypothetical protein
MDNTNPAARLHNILTTAHSLIQNPSGRPISQGWSFWSLVFDIRIPNNVNDVPLREIVQRLLQLQLLIDETEERLRRIGDLPDRYFRPFSRLRAVPIQSLMNLNQEVSGTVRQITEGDITVLEFCAERLESQHAEAIVDEKELQAILDDITILFDEVKTSSVNTDLKTFILDGLESIRRGIYEFRIRGPERLKEAIAEIIGNYAVNHPQTQSPEDKENFAKFQQSFKRFVAVVSFAHTGMKYIQMFTGPLLPGASN